MSRSKNTIEDELNKIRIELYEAEKHLSSKESVKKAKERTKKYAEKYGLKIVSRV